MGGERETGGRGGGGGIATLMATAGRDVASLFALTDTLRDDDMAACVAGCRSCSCCFCSKSC